MTTKSKNNFRGFTPLEIARPIGPSGAQARARFLTGLTLIEAIISITILSLILFIVYSSFTLSRRSYIEGENIAEITQNGRVILERLSREIRQAKEIVTELPDDRTAPPAEIKVHDGHLSLVSEQDICQGATLNTIFLAASASEEEDYYENMFIKITEGTGIGQSRKIYAYDGVTKTAQIDRNWETIPDITSTYKIDTSFYYIYYYLFNNNILRKVITYCFANSGSSICVQPETYVSWDATPPVGQELLELELEPAQIIGEYLTDLEFWGSRIINIALVLQKQEKSIDFQTKIFGRNL